MYSVSKFGAKPARLSMYMEVLKYVLTIGSLVFHITEVVLSGYTKLVNPLTVSVTWLCQQCDRLFHCWLLFLIVQ